MIEDGDTYDTLRGVSIDGQAEIVDDDPDLLLRVGISVWERYTGPYTEEMRPFVDQMMNNRIAVRVVPTRTAQLGPPQAGHGRDAGVGVDRAVPELTRSSSSGLGAKPGFARVVAVAVPICPRASNNAAVPVATPSWPVNVMAASPMSGPRAVGSASACSRR